jgi:hypothetical protein
MKKVVYIFSLAVLGGLFYWFNPFTNEYSRNVNFQVEIPTNTTDSKVGIRGNIPPLSWERTIYLPKLDSNVFGSKLTFKTSIKNLEYKYVLENKELVWELNSALNRQLEYRYRPVEKWNQYSPSRPLGLDTSLLSSDKLAVDLEVLGKALKELHPSLTKYQSEESYQNNLKSLRDSWTKEQKKSNAYVQLAQFLASIKCGHTQLNPYNQNDRTQKSLIKRKNKLPFTFVLIEDRAFIDKIMDDLDLEKGDEIISINQVPWSEILNRLMTVARGDGSNDCNRKSRFSLIGHGKPEFFDIYFPMMFPVIEDSISLKIKRGKGAIAKNFNIPLVSVDSRTEELKNKYPSLSTSYEDLWKWELLDGNIGYLKLETYTTWNFNFDWEQFLIEAMDNFKKNKVKDIIIDIRGNEGGNDEVLEILSKYTHTKPVSTGGYPNVIRYQKVSDDIRPYLRTWADELYNVKLFTKEYKDGYYIRLGESSEPKIKPASGDALNARFHYLVDATNSSATFNQSKMIKENKLGTLIGETTGGNYRGITGGYMFFLTLPESGFTVDIPLSTILMPEGTPDKGVTPDVEVKYTYEGFMTERDDVLEGALAFLVDSGQ